MALIHSIIAVLDGSISQTIPGRPRIYSCAAIFITGGKQTKKVSRSMFSKLICATASVGCKEWKDGYEQMHTIYYT